jgi:hypothetical protein
MALAERATLVAELRLDDKMTGGLAKAGRGLSKFEGVASRTGRGLKTLGGNLAKIGVAAGVAGAALAGAAIKAGISSLAELEDATTAVDGALKAVGKTGQTTSAEIAGWANDIEASVQAAFDDKAIVAGAATLLRYGKVSTKSLRPAMVVMTDLAAKTGDVGSAAEKLAKALANPTKATRVLREVGVTLTEDEEKRIKTLVKLGRLEDAQAIILGRVAAATKGAAEASKGPYNDALNELADITEDTQRALAEGFLPVIKDVAAFLRTELVKPEVKQGIKDLGKGLAGAFQAAVGFAKQIPWGAVAGAARGIAGFAKQALDLFNMMPDWAKSILIGGFVANKLTGGLVKDLASGLIKGVLGINAGVVNVRGAVVNGLGGLGGGKGGPGGVVTGGKGFGGSLLGAAKALGALAIAGIAVEKLFEQWGTFRGEGAAGAETLRQQTAAGVPQLDREGATAALRNVREQLNNPINDLALKLSGTYDQVKATEKALVDRLAVLGGGVVGGGRGDKSTADEVKRLGEQMAGMDGVVARAVAAGLAPTKAGIVATMEKNVRATQSGDDRTALRIDSLNSTAVREAERTGRLADATRSGLSNVTSAANATTAAVRGLQLNPTFSPVINVNTGFTVRSLARNTTITKSYRPVVTTGTHKAYEPT